MSTSDSGFLQFTKRVPVVWSISVSLPLSDTQETRVFYGPFPGQTTHSTGPTTVSLDPLSQGTLTVVVATTVTLVHFSVSIRYLPLFDSDDTDLPLSLGSTSYRDSESGVVHRPGTRFYKDPDLVPSESCTKVFRRSRPTKDG